MRWTAALLGVAAAVGLGACGTDGGQAGSGTTTSGSVTGPSISTPTTTTVPGTLSTAIGVTTSGTDTVADLPGTGRPTVLVGDMNTPEQFIIGDLYADALGAQGYTVTVNRNIGPTAVSEAAMQEGSLDLFPEYLNVYDTQVAADSTRYLTLKAAFDAGQNYARANAQTLLPPTPFSDTAGIVVLTRFARAHALHTMADLHRVGDLLTFGSPLEFSAEPGGLGTLEQAYDFAPAVTTVVTTGTQYRALADGEITAAYDQTTDWQLTDPVFTNLRDSHYVLGFGNVVPVLSTAVLSAEGPVFAQTINRVDALLSTRAIRGLTAEMQDATQPAVAAAEVAKEFLQGYDILPPPSWSTTTTTTATATLSNVPSTEEHGHSGVSSAP